MVESNGHIDLVISDIVMNGTSGFDLVRWLRTRQPDVAILLISGYPQPSEDGVLDEVPSPAAW